MDEGARLLFFDHVRWRMDQQDARLTSINGRAGALIGWSSTQVTISLGVVGLASQIDESWSKTTGLWLLGSATLALAVGVVMTVIAVLRPRSTVSPSSDLAATWSELRSADGKPDMVAHLAETLIGSIVGNDGDPPVLSEFADAVNARGKSLRIAMYVVAGAVIADSFAAILLIAAITGS